MQLQTLRLRNFRNYTRLDLTLTAGATLLYGPNAAGKTSILEAAYLLAMTRSPRTANDRELVCWHAPIMPDVPVTAHVGASVSRRFGPTQLDAIIQVRDPHNDQSGTSKILRVDHKPVRASDFLGFLRVVFFAPTDLELITGAPSERRRWVDAMLSQLDGTYLRALTGYTKALTQRNALLRHWREQRRLPRQPGTELRFWDEQLAEHGALIMTHRHTAMHQLSTLAAPLYGTIAQTTNQLHIEYQPNTPPESYTLVQVREFLLATLQHEHGQDIARCQTQSGPHRDDFLVRDEHIDLGVYGSRGQQRSGVMALKLGEVAFLHQRTHERPVLLLDDVLSELDSSRRRHLLEVITHPEQQSILTATGIGDFDAQFLAQARLMRVDQGSIFDVST